jgi:glycosyltransferase involved in cell wall biosynthesis
MYAEWLMSQFAHKVVGVSDHTTENLIKFEKISRKKTMTIVNGIDGSKYDVAIDKNQKRKELGLKETGPIIGACVRLTEQKGLSYLLEAVQRIKPQFPDISVLVAGEGPLEQRLINQCRDSGIDKNVFFIGPRTDVPEILKLLDIYVLPSVWEGLPMILLEAMAAECPIIASRVGGVPGIIKHGLNGSLVAPRDPEGLATEIIRVLKDRRLRDKYASEGLWVFREKYTVEAMTRQYERLYLGLN